MVAEQCDYTNAISCTLKKMVKMVNFIYLYFNKKESKCHHILRDNKYLSIGKKIP